MLRSIALAALVAGTSDLAAAATTLDLNQPCVLTEGASLGSDFKGHDTRMVAKSLEAAGGKKDEFETSDEYKKRIQIALNDQPAAISEGALCATNEEVRASSVSYDADAQTLWVDIEALNEMGSYLPEGGIDDVYVRVVRSATWDKSTDEEERSNAFGATVNVTSYHSSTASVGFNPERFESQLKSNGTECHRGQYVKHWSIPIAMPHDSARRLKGNVGVAYLYKSIPPYRGTGTEYSRATIDRPSELFVKTVTVLGELRGIAVFEGSSGHVLKVIRMDGQ